MWACVEAAAGGQWTVRSCHKRHPSSPQPAAGTSPHLDNQKRQFTSRLYSNDVTSFSDNERRPVPAARITMTNKTLISLIRARPPSPSQTCTRCLTMLWMESAILGEGVKKARLHKMSLPIQTIDFHCFTLYIAPSLSIALLVPNIVNHRLHVCSPPISHRWAGWVGMVWSVETARPNPRK